MEVRIWFLGGNQPARHRSVGLAGALLIAALLLAQCGAPTADPAQSSAPTAAPAAAPTAAAQPEATQSAAATPVADAATAPPAQPDASSATYRSAFRTGCMQGPLWTTCGHRLDATVLQPLAAIKWTADGLQPLLAESWEAEDGGKSWLIHLRKNVSWHDGAPFTADDVVFSFNLYANPVIASSWATKVQDIQGYDEFKDGEAEQLSGVTKVDDSTVRIELKQALPLWMQLNQIFVVIMPEAPARRCRPGPAEGPRLLGESRGHRAVQVGRV